MAPPSLPGVQVAPVPPLRRYYEALRRPAVPLALLRGFARRYHPVRLCSSLRLGPTPAGGLELSGGAAPRPNMSRWRGPGLPGSWGTLVCLCPVLRPRQDRLHQALRCADAAPATPYIEGSHASVNFGAQWHGFNTRCLRFAGGVASTRRLTRFRLLARLYRAGLVTCKAPTKGFRDGPYMSSSFPKLSWRKRCPLFFLPLFFLLSHVVPLSQAFLAQTVSPFFLPFPFFLPLFPLACCWRKVRIRQAPRKPKAWHDPRVPGKSGEKVEVLVPAKGVEVHTSLSASAMPRLTASRPRHDNRKRLTES